MTTSLISAKPHHVQGLFAITRRDCPTGRWITFVAVFDGLFEVWIFIISKATAKVTPGEARAQHLRNKSLIHAAHVTRRFVVQKDLGQN